jgi:hypothetical protein
MLEARAKLAMQRRFFSVCQKLTIQISKNIRTKMKHRTEVTFVKPVIIGVGLLTENTFTCLSLLSGREGFVLRPISTMVSLVIDNAYLGG